MYTFCIVLIIIASILLVLAVLVQSPKSGMAANFGASNQVMGVRQTADFLEKATWGLAAVILLLSILTVAISPKKIAVEDKNKSELAGQLPQSGDETTGIPLQSEAAASSEATTNGNE